MSLDRYLRGPLSEVERYGEPAELPGVMRAILLVDGPRAGTMLDLAADASFAAVPNGYEPTPDKASARALFPDRYQPRTRADVRRVLLLREVWRYVL